MPVANARKMSPLESLGAAADARQPDARALGETRTGAAAAASVAIVTTIGPIPASPCASGARNAKARAAALRRPDNRPRAASRARRSSPARARRRSSRPTPAASTRDAVPMPPLELVADHPRAAAHAAFGNRPRLRGGQRAAHARRSRAGPRYRSVARRRFPSRPACTSTRGRRRFALVRDERIAHCANAVRVRIGDRRGQQAGLADPFGPVASPLPFSTCTPAKHGESRGAARGSMTVTPVRIDASPFSTFSVQCPTRTPGTSVIALKRPGVPVRCGCRDPSCA